MNPFRAIGKAFLGFLEATGKLALFTLRSLSHCLRPPFYFRLLGRQMIDIGYYSLPVVGMTTLFAGMALGLQTYAGFSRFSAEDAIAKVVGLGAEVGELSPAELSGGMQKRVGLARAIATEPEIIFFDEPTTGLDPIMGDVINDQIVKCVKELGATALSITHDISSARKISDRIAMLYKGKIIWNGPTDTIDDSGNPHVDQFIHGRAEGPIQMELRRL